MLRRDAEVSLSRRHPTQQRVQSEEWTTCVDSKDRRLQDAGSIPARSMNQNNERPFNQGTLHQVWDG